MDRRHSARPCPICGRPEERRFRPFCSSRCADVDLNRWLSGVYAVPATEGDDEADEQVVVPFPGSVARSP